EQIRNVSPRFGPCHASHAARLFPQAWPAQKVRLLVNKWVRDYAIFVPCRDGSMSSFAPRKNALSRSERRLCGGTQPALRQMVHRAGFAQARPTLQSLARIQ